MKAVFSPPLPLPPACAKPRGYNKKQFVNVSYKCEAVDINFGIIDAQNS